MPELVGKFRDTGLVEVKKEVLNREQGPFEGAACSWTAPRTTTGMKLSWSIGSHREGLEVEGSKDMGGDPTPECSITPVNWGLSGAVDRWQRPL
jgi:hypothetical protein